MMSWAYVGSQTGGQALCGLQCCVFLAILRFLAPFRLHTQSIRRTGVRRPATHCALRATAGRQSAKTADAPATEIPSKHVHDRLLHHRCPHPQQ